VSPSGAVSPIGRKIQGRSEIPPVEKSRGPNSEFNASASAERVLST